MKCKLRYLPLFVCFLSGKLDNALCSNADPVVIYYPRSECKAKSQNWDIACDNNGSVFFANNDGLLEYDGFKWHLHTHPSAMNTHSLYYDKDEKRLYAGYFEEFGYWQRDEFGVLNYTSISKNVSTKKLSNNSIWSIEKLDSIVYFQSFSTVFYYSDEVRI